MLLLLSNIHAEETDIELDGLFTPEVFASKSKNSFLVDRPAPITPECPRPYRLTCVETIWIEKEIL